MHRIGFACSVVALLLSLRPYGSSAAQIAGPVAPSLRGTWVVIEAERELAPYPELQGATVAFGDTAFRIERTEGRAPWYGVLTVDEARKQIGLLHLYKGFMMPTFGTLWEGLYKFDGDTLVIVHAEGHDARPTEFSTGYDVTLIKLRRKDAAVPSMASLLPDDAARGIPETKARSNYAPTAQRLLYTAARSLGMLRGAQENDTLYTIIYNGTGTMSDQASGAGPSQPVALSHYQAEIDYRQGMRLDVSRGTSQAPASRQVSVVVGKAAWDEGGLTLDGPEMGSVQNPMPAMVDYRRVQLYLTPFGAVKAARSIAGQVMVTALAHGAYQLTYPYLGTTWKLSLDPNRRPMRIETTVNLPALGPNTPIVATYSGYKEFILGDVQFPSHIVQTLAGKTVLDLQVTRCRCNNPYVIFPVPESLARDAAAR